MKQINEEWKVLESEYLIQRPWLTARRDKVELPDGRIVPEYYVLEYPDWVNVIAITKEGDFVMEKQYRHAARRISYELPFCVMEKGRPFGAAQREIIGGDGLAVAMQKLMASAIQYDDQYDHCFWHRRREGCGSLIWMRLRINRPFHAPGRGETYVGAGATLSGIDDRPAL